MYTLFDRILDWLHIDGFTYQDGFKDGFWTALAISGFLFLIASLFLSIRLGLFHL